MLALRRIARTTLTPVLTTCLFAGSSLAGAEGWKTEPNLDPPGYAVIEPRSSDLNIDAVVLACEPGDDRRVLQLQLYLTNDGPLLPHGVVAGRLKTEPRAEIAIDGQVFPVDLLFAGDHVVLADERDEAYPRLSGSLLDAMEQGATMKLRFDLVAEPSGQPAVFDGEAVVDLQAGPASERGQAVVAVRRCAAGTDLHSAALSSERR